MPPNVRTIEPTPPTSPSIAIVVSRYNAWITDELLKGALEAIERLAPDANVTVLPVPGAWELSTGASMAIGIGADALVCLACVIKGETEHDRFINDAVSSTLVRYATELPLGFGLLTVNNAEQAEARAGGAMGNKGAEAAEAALDMLGLVETLTDEVMS
jgi:6,7-dimethyl-8-ribityllumazine synthase